MERIAIGDLTLDDLKRHPVWAWSCASTDDRENLIAPVTASTVDQCDTGVLIVYSKLTTAARKVHDGLVVYDVFNAEVFAAAMFYGDELCDMNRNIGGEVAMTELEGYVKFSGDRPRRIFPIRYEVVPSELGIPPGDFTIPLDELAD